MILCAIAVRAREALGQPACLLILLQPHSKAIPSPIFCIIVAVKTWSVLGKPATTTCNPVTPPLCYITPHPVCSLPTITSAPSTVCPQSSRLQASCLKERLVYVSYHLVHFGTGHFWALINLVIFCTIFAWILNTTNLFVNTTPFWNKLYFYIHSLNCVCVD